MAYTPINKGQFSLEPPERLEAFERMRGSGVAEAYRENRRQWEDFPRRQVVPDHPLHVDIELASICNLRCPMCYTITDAFKKQVRACLMDFGLFTRLVDQCAAGGVYSIRLSFRGEAFLHPEIVNCVRYAKAKGIQEVSSLTNCERLDEKMFQEIMEAGLDWLTISADGVGEIYEQIRRPAKFDRLVEKIAHFKQIKEAAGRVKPAIKVQTILSAIESDPQGFYDIFAPIVDLVSANPLIDFMRDVSELPKIADFTCPQVFQRLVIGADGLCMMCSNDEPGYVIVGDANTQSIHEIWHGAPLSRVRDLHRSHQACRELEPCRRCYLPLETFDAIVQVDGREVIAQKYVGGVERVDGLETPDRWKRKGLSA